MRSGTTGVTGTGGLMILNIEGWRMEVHCRVENATGSVEQHVILKAKNNRA
jgi:hypothetical protein